MVAWRSCRWPTHGADLPDGLRAEAVLASRPDRVVVRARRGTEPPVVVKATPPAAGWAARSALRREGRLLALLDHDAVVRLLDVVDRRGRTVLVFELVPAGTLARRIEHQAVPDLEGIGRQLSEAVASLHRAGLSHGAIRSEHVVLRADGCPVLCGFGSARRSDDVRTDEAALADLLRQLRDPAAAGRPRSPDGPRPGRHRP